MVIMVELIWDLALGNRIGVDGARVLADALVHENCRLTSIEIGCELSDIDVN